MQYYISPQCPIYSPKSTFANLKLPTLFMQLSIHSNISAIFFTVKILEKDWQFLEEDQMVFYHRRPISLLHCFVSNRIFFICSIFSSLPYRKSLMKEEKGTQSNCQAVGSFSPSFLLWQVYRFRLWYSWWCVKFMKDTAEIKRGKQEGY